MLAEKFAYTQLESDFIFYTFSKLFSTHTIEYLNNINTYEYSLIQGHRTDCKDRIWMHKINDPVISRICNFFNTSGKIIFGNITNNNFTNCRTRLEICNDAKGSYLQNHVDDPAKVFTLQLNLSNSNTGTILNKLETKGKTNTGWFFVNTGSEWHKLNKLKDNRSSIILNYVNDAWRDSDVLI